MGSLILWLPWCRRVAALNRGYDDMSDDGDLTHADYYHLIRSQIEHEDELVNLRVVWQLLVQSFFFSAYATLLNAPQEAKKVFFERLQELLTWLIPTAGLLAGLLTFVSIFTALQTVRFLESNTRPMIGWSIAMRARNCFPQFKDHASCGDGHRSVPLDLYRRVAHCYCTLLRVVTIRPSAVTYS